MSRRDPLPGGCLMVVIVGVIGFFVLLHTRNTDDIARASCRSYMAQSASAAESAASLSERPQRELLREFAPTCRELLLGGHR